ncbi:MAG TPA: SDR family oxidoreductase [Chthoniobacteraceae bacterium]|jgi:uncharacterized oxidoreductase|nr:SDR family oxidoreductase [Chthoniobacteraceae bacterium]
MSLERGSLWDALSGYRFGHLMKFTDNTILITGGSSGIGRGLAEALHALGNRVIITGRRKELLEEVAAANPGMVCHVLDVDDRDAVRIFVEKVTGEFPGLNVLVNNAGIMRPEDLREPGWLADSEAVITTNLLGPVRMTAGLLPHLLKQPAAAILNVSSGLGFVPLPVTPTYSATKAALHSFTVSLRVQLKGTAVEVIEIIPPAVATDLTPGRSTNDQRMMSLEDFITETMDLLKAQPTPEEITVERVKFLRFAEATGAYDKALAMLSGISV